MRTEWFAFEALFLGAKSGPGKQIRLNLFTPGVLRITTELTAWYATDFTIALVICIALAVYGFLHKPGGAAVVWREIIAGLMELTGVKLLGSAGKS